MIQICCYRQEPQSRGWTCLLWYETLQYPIGPPQVFSLACTPPTHAHRANYYMWYHNATISLELLRIGMSGHNGPSQRYKQTTSNVRPCCWVFDGNPKILSSATHMPMLRVAMHGGVGVAGPMTLSLHMQHARTMNWANHSHARLSKNARQAHQVQRRLSRIAIRELHVKRPN